MIGSVTLLAAIPSASSPNSNPSNLALPSSFVTASKSTSVSAPEASLLLMNVPAAASACVLAILKCAPFSATAGSVVLSYLNTPTPPVCTSGLSDCLTPSRLNIKVAWLGIDSFNPLILPFTFNANFVLYVISSVEPSVRLFPPSNEPFINSIASSLDILLNTTL